MKNSNAEPASVGSRVPRDREKPSWPMVRLGDVCKFQRGLTYKKSDEVTQSDNIVLRSNNIDLEQGTLDLRELKCIREDLFVPADKKVIPGSILMCMANGSKSHLGKVALVQDDLGYAFGGFMGLLVPEGIDSSYLYLALRSASFKECIRKLQDGANINNLKFADFCDFQIPLPPISVQREIVARLEKELGEADALAAKFKEIAENADAEFKAELDETFKGLDGARNCFETSCCMKRGEYITRKEARCGNIPVILGGKEPAYFIDRSNHDGECLVISRSGASAGFVSYWNEPIFVTDGFIIEVKKNADIRFAYYYYQSLYEQLGKSKNGSAIPHVTGSGIQALGFPGTSLLVQKEIVAKLEAVREKCDRLKAAAERGLRAAEDLRKAILAEAFEQ